MFILHVQPGTGKTNTLATILYQLCATNPGKQVLVTAPSNVAVDQLTEHVHRTGLKVVRVSAKSREQLDSTEQFLTLHEQMRNNDTFPELQKLMRLKEEVRGLTAKDEKKFNILQRACKREILAVNSHAFNMFSKVHHLFIFITLPM